MRSLGFLLAAIGLLLLPAGCDHTINSICKQTCTCQPCTQADLDSCLTTGDDARAAAEKKGCSSQLDTFLHCMDDTLSCRQGTSATTDQCTKEEQALIACSGSGNPFLSVCQQATVKSSMCTGSTPPPDLGSSCPAQSACQSKCVLETDCDVLIGVKFDQNFQNCLSACAGVPPMGGGTGAAGGGFDGGF
jgi:hypothetical protein